MWRTDLYWDGTLFSGAVIEDAEERLPDTAGAGEVEGKVVSGNAMAVPPAEGEGLDAAEVVPVPVPVLCPVVRSETPDEALLPVPATGVAVVAGVAALDGDGPGSDG